MMNKYLAQTVFDSTTMNSANTTGTSAQFDIGEFSRLWAQVSATSANTSTDVSVQLQVSNDPMVLPSASSTWLSQDSAATYAGTSIFDKHSDVCAQKMRWTLARNGGSGVVTVRVVGKP